MLDYHLWICSRLKEIRRSRKLTQAQLAGALGVSYQQVQKYESGTNRISAGRLYQIARVLRVRPATFFKDMPSMEGETGSSGAQTKRCTRPAALGPIHPS
ncbi:MAG: hypothetical protein Kilf2KO_34850 [Rhodospirillales bacterium]